jgi:hypothetical protein
MAPSSGLIADSKGRILTSLMLAEEIGPIPLDGFPPFINDFEFGHSARCDADRFTGHRISSHMRFPAAGEKRSKNGQ